MKLAVAEVESRASVVPSTFRIMVLKDVLEMENLKNTELSSGGFVD